MELSPGLHRIGTDIVAFHLVVAPDGITLIDAGLPGHWREFVADFVASDAFRSAPALPVTTESMQ